MNHRNKKYTKARTVVCAILHSTGNCGVCMCIDIVRISSMYDFIKYCILRYGACITSVYVLSVSLGFKERVQ